MKRAFIKMKTLGKKLRNFQHEIPDTSFMISSSPSEKHNFPFFKPTKKWVSQIPFQLSKVIAMRWKVPRILHQSPQITNLT